MRDPINGFLETIVNDPDDIGSRLVLADWLEEQERYELAGILRQDGAWVLSENCSQKAGESGWQQWLAYLTVHPERPVRDVVGPVDPVICASCTCRVATIWVKKWVCPSCKAKVSGNGPLSEMMHSILQGVITHNEALQGGLLPSNFVTYNSWGHDWTQSWGTTPEKEKDPIPPKPDNMTWPEFLKQLADNPPEVEGYELTPHPDDWWGPCPLAKFF